MKNVQNDRKHLSSRQIINRFKKGEYVDESIEAVSSAISSYPGAFEGTSLTSSQARNSLFRKRNASSGNFGNKVPFFCQTTFRIIPKFAPVFPRIIPINYMGFERFIPIFAL